MAHPIPSNRESRKKAEPEKILPKKTSVMTDDEKVDEASRESMDASDPPAYISLRTGSPPQRRQ